MSVLRKLVRALELILQQPPIDLGKDLCASCLPVKILDRQVEAKQGMMTMWVKVRTERDEIHEEASETKQMDYSEFCCDVDWQSWDDSNSGTNSLLVGENCNDLIPVSEFVTRLSHMHLSEGHLFAYKYPPPHWFLLLQQENNKIRS